MGTVPSTQSNNSPAGPTSSTTVSQFAGPSSSSYDTQRLQFIPSSSSGPPPGSTAQQSSNSSFSTSASPTNGHSSAGTVHQALSHLDAASMIQALAASPLAYQKHLHEPIVPTQSPASPTATSAVSPTSSSSSSSPGRSRTSPKRWSPVGGTSDHLPEDDGYRWRKYGRKSVKGSDFPRSYYKCTYPGCTVKKQVETAIKNGAQVLHTTYKGDHTHEAPQITRVNAEDQTTFKNSVMTEFLGAASALAADTIATMATSRTSPGGGATQHSSAQTSSGGSGGTSSGAMPSGSAADRPGGPHPPPSARLVVETKVGVDFLDDGYHWRKYGQKNVKGSAYPRSYYKCTEKDCPVKKQVEQSGSHVINTYEGTHNHLAPGLEENSRKRRRRKKRKDGTEGEGDSQANDDDRSPPPARKRSRTGSFLVPSSHATRDSLTSSLSSSASSIFALVSASNSPSLSLSPALGSSSCSSLASSSSSSLYGVLPSSAWTHSALGHTEPAARSGGADCGDSGRGGSGSEPTTPPAAYYPHHFPGLSSFYSVLGSPTATTSPLPSSFAPPTPSLSAMYHSPSSSSLSSSSSSLSSSLPSSSSASSSSSAYMLSPSLQTILSSTMSLSPMFDAPTPQPASPLARRGGSMRTRARSSDADHTDDEDVTDNSEGEAVDHRLSADGDDTLLPKTRDHDDAMGDRDESAEPMTTLPPLLPHHQQLPSFASFAASTSLPASSLLLPAASSSTSPPPATVADLSVLLYPFAAAAAAAAAATAPSTLSPPSSSASLNAPAGLFSSDAAATAALLLINESLAELD